MRRNANCTQRQRNIWGTELAHPSGAETVRETVRRRVRERILRSQKKQIPSDKVGILERFARMTTCPE